MSLSTSEILSTEEPSGNGFEYDVKLEPHLSELENKVRALFQSCCESKLRVIEETHLSLIKETEKLWGPSAGVGTLKLSRLIKTLNEYLESGLPQQHKAVGGFITDVAKGLDEIKAMQPPRVKRPLSDPSLVKFSSDSKAEQEAKASKKTLKSLGISPKVKVPFQEVVIYQFSRQGRLRLLGIEAKVTAVVKEFLNAWSVVVYQSLKDPENAPDRINNLKKLALDQGEYLKTYVDQSAKYIVDQIAEDVHKISIIQIRALQKSRSAELDELRTKLIREKASWGQQIKLWSSSVVLSLQLSRLKNNVSAELDALLKETNDEIFDPLNREIQKAEKLLEHIGNLIDEDRMEDASKLTVTLNHKASFDEIQVNESLQFLRHFTRKLPTSVTTFTDDDVEVNIDAAYLTDYVVEMQLTSELQALLMELPSRASSSISTIANNMKLMGFTLSADVEESEGDLAVDEVLTKCIKSLEESREALNEVKVDFRHKFETIKKEAFDGLTVARLLENAPIARREKKNDGVSYDKSRFYSRWLNRTGLMIHKYSRIINTHKDELLYAEFKAKNAKDESPHAFMRNFYESVSPSSEVLSALPVYYKQLFVGKHAPRENLFIHREREIQQAKQAVKRLKLGSGGAIVALGDSLSGKSFFIEMASRIIDTEFVYRIDPPPTGSTNPDNLLKIVAHQIGVESRGIDTFGQAPVGSVFLFDDLELWWARHAEGWKTIELFCDVVERYSRDYIFIVSMNSNAYRLIKNRRRFANAFIETIPMAPFTLKKLEEALVERHKTGGLQIQLDGVSEANISAKKQKAFLETVLEKSDGNIGVAFNLWLGHIFKVDNKVLIMRSGKYRDLPIVTDKLWLIALAQLSVHKTTGPKKLSQVLSLPQGETLSLLSNLRRAALIEDIAGGGFQISPYMQPYVIKRLKKLQLI